MNFFIFISYINTLNWIGFFKKYQVIRKFVMLTQIWSTFYIKTNIYITALTPFSSIFTVLIFCKVCCFATSLFRDPKHFVFTSGIFQETQVCQNMVPTWTGKPGKMGKLFSSQGILHRLEKSGNLQKNTGKVREI